MTSPTIREADRAGFTPGPWSISSGDLLRVTKGELAICGVHRLGKNTGGERSAEVQANARLIASAPAMFKALIECREIARNMAAYLYADTISGMDREDIERVCDAALALAQPKADQGGE